MNNESIILLIGGCSAVFGFVAWVGLMVVPAWRSYDRLWQRCSSVFLSLYAAAALILIGVGVGAAVVWFWDRFSA